MKFFLILSSVLFLSLFSAASLPAQNVEHQSAGNGSEALPHYAHVDTLRGRLAALGTGVAAERFTEPETIRRSACLAAELDARRKLVELAHGLNLDSSTVVQNYAVETDMSRVNSAGALGPVTVDEEVMVEPRTCRVTISAELPSELRKQLPLAITPLEPSTEIRMPMMNRPR
ncbi:hypothetical protein DPQ33_00855 [Oceanidesulfovibrio indonesiensis]|uniref:Uncharacterized protein n=1 Tax=Oceanidesulfovibrio indonesiensis TaxID=54767 RepID=A0A7M3MJ29_9BACT|nr:hypothetical protein [Oceanidesulfovibrio indonesiensis]TVM19817.1 hypothetical protein DPQ33_00855 [Oceanidesulfovibrio indonesiensis]